MRYSVVRCGVCAFLIGLGQSPFVLAQDNSTRSDQQIQSNSSQPLGVLLRLPEQAKQSPLSGAIDLGKNAQQQYPIEQLDSHWAWEQNKDGLAWFALRNDRFSGMSIVPVDDALRSHLKIPKGQGLLVTALDPHSPATQAGLRQNDVLLKLGDTPLGKPEHLEAGLKSAGDKPVVLHLYRDGSARKIQVQPRIQVSFGPVLVEPPALQFWIGVSVADVEPALRAQLQLPANKGLLVNEVFKESPAEKAGLKVNDILLSLDGKPLSDQKKLVELVQANGEKMITLELLHEGKPRGDVEVTPERRKSNQLSGSGSGSVDLSHVFLYDVVRPGVMLNQTGPYQLQLQDLNALNSLEVKSKDQRSKDPNAALSKRLDDLDAEIKKLRKALEELGGASKATAELNRAIEVLKKLSADKK